MSIGGGLPRAVDRAAASRCDALQIFTKSAGQWRARALPAEEISRFRDRVEETGIQPVVAHNSYLINLAAASPALRAQSFEALREELDRADVLGLAGLVMHPGSYTSGTEEDGLRLIAEGIARLLEERPRVVTRILLEHTAGQGTNLGHRFEHIASILDRLDGSPASGCASTRATSSPRDTISVHRKATRARSRSSIASSGSTGSPCSTSTTRRSPVAAASTVTSTSARAAWGSSRSACC